MVLDFYSISGTPYSACLFYSLEKYEPVSGKSKPRTKICSLPVSHSL